MSAAQPFSRVGLGLDLAVFLLFLFGASSYFAYAMGFGLAGDHVWRQSDAYAQILSFFDPALGGAFNDFNGNFVIYDIPIYQLLVVGVAKAFNLDPLLAARLFNILLFGSILYSGGRIADSFAPGARLPFYALVCVSPPFLHYFSTPLPDTLSLALSGLGLMALVCMPNSTGARWSATIVIGFAALIKSPIPFVFLSYFLALFLLDGRRKHCDTRTAFKHVLPIYSVALICALGAELSRHVLLSVADSGLSGSLKWYFGTWQQRLDSLWLPISRLRSAFPFTWMYQLFLLACLGCIFAAYKLALHTLIPASLAFIAGWAIFTNVYVLHDYYQLPVHMIAFLTGAIAITTCLKRLHSLFSKQPSPHSISTFTVGLILSISVPLTIIATPRGNPLTNERVFSTIRYYLQDVETVLYVTQVRNPGPSFGGRVGRHFVTQTHEEFQQGCAVTVLAFQAIVSDGPSDCLFRNRHIAAIYAKDTRYTLWVRNSPTNGFTGSIQ